MMPLDEIEQYLYSSAKTAMDNFNREISTDENKDYRRGFLAGVLFSFLQAKSNIGNLDNATTERSKY